MKQTIGFLSLSLFLLVGCDDSMSKRVENNQINENNSILSSTDKLQKTNREQLFNLKEKIALIKKDLAELFRLNETILNKTRQEKPTNIYKIA